MLEKVLVLQKILSNSRKTIIKWWVWNT